VFVSIAEVGMRNDSIVPALRYAVRAFAATWLPARRVSAVVPTVAPREP